MYLYVRRPLSTFMKRYVIMFWEPLIKRRDCRQEYYRPISLAKTKYKKNKYFRADPDLYDPKREHNWFAGFVADFRLSAKCKSPLIFILLACLQYVHDSFFSCC